MSGLLRAGPVDLWLPGRRVKPNGIPRLDWTHPLTRGLESYWFDIGGLYIDLVNGHSTIISAGTPGAVVPSRYGSGLALNVSSVGINDKSLAGTQAWASPYSCAQGWLQLGAPANSANNCFYFGLNDASNNDPFVFYVGGGGGTALGVSFGNAGTGSTFNLADNAYPTFYVAVGVATAAATQTVWVFDDGAVPTYTWAGTATSAYTATGAGYTFGTGNYGAASTASNPNAIIFFGAAWKRALTLTEAQLLYSDPYCFLLPPDPFMPVPYVAAGGTNALGNPPAFASAATVLATPTLAVLPIYLGDQVLSAGIVTLNSQATHVYVCSAQPANYAGVAGIALGSANPGVGNVAAAPSGRGAAVNAVNVTMTGAGTAACWTITDNTNSRLLATGPLSANQVVAINDIWQLPAFTITLPN